MSPLHWIVSDALAQRDPIARATRHSAQLASFRNPHILGKEAELAFAETLRPGSVTGSGRVFERRELESEKISPRGTGRIFDHDAAPGRIFHDDGSLFNGFSPGSSMTASVVSADGFARAATNARARELMEAIEAEKEMRRTAIAEQLMALRQLTAVPLGDLGGQRRW